MSREIKFRGLFKGMATTYWVYGSYICNKGKGGEYHAIASQSLTDEDSMSTYQIIKETVGQFTGLKDKNGVDIYEGDILRLPPENKWQETNYSSFEIFFHDNDCCDHNIGWQMNRMHNHGSVAGGYCGHKFRPQTTAKFIVIGNIHEQGEKQ